METLLGILILVGLIVIGLLIALYRAMGKEKVDDSLPQPMIEIISNSIANVGALKSQIDTLSAGQAPLHQAINGLQSIVKGLETKIVETSGSVKDSLSADMAGAKNAIEKLKTQLEERKVTDDELRVATKRIEGVITGGSSRGAAGENILEEAFKQFPPGMIETNFKVKGKPVEYALILTNDRRLAIDSKWPVGSLLEQLALETNPDPRAILIQEIEKALIRKSREVTQYIDPTTTLPWAIAAVPDAAFSVCRQAHILAFKDRVILMPYSMAIPFILALYNLHLQYTSSIDMERLDGYLQQIERGLEAVDKALENSIARGSTMVSNACTECKRLVGEMRGASAYLRAAPSAPVTTKEVKEISAVPADSDSPLS